MKANVTSILATNFVTYCMDFYGPKGIYPMGATRKIVTKALKEHMESGADVAFDSFDREKVRDIMIEKHGLVFPTAKAAV